MCRLALPAMRRRGRGTIVNVSSMGGRLVFPGAGWYHASKHALEALSDALRFEVRPFGVDVVVVEPGLVRTEFANAVSAAIAAAGTDDGPYATFDTAVDRRTRSAYESGPLARFSRPPDAVAAVIERAIEAERPRTRYADPGARALLAARRLLPDRAWDAAMRLAYPQPQRVR
jgi:NAD(P)-dependent dehydrogenase (short-subunit alcohol dehydrogenase family)